ncbi:MAG TPA: TonB-dependent receptor [Daejeonella sp.]|nr:TonB-dependent receptor [Daejeonella sp.]
MKVKLLLLAIALLFTPFIYADTLILNGKVIDAKTRESLPGATVSIPDLRISIVTDDRGEFIFKNIPERGKFLIEIKYLGYKTFTQMVDLGVSSNMQFALEPATIETQEVVITGTAYSTDNRKNSTSVASISKDQLINVPSANLIDAIAKVPGVSQITTGGGISKPVIRGLGYNRVVTLVDGAKQEGQQWGDEHGIEIDQYNAERVEVLRGAASLLYGSDAIGGVINVLEPLPAAEGQIKGEFLSNYSGNNGLTGNSAMLQGNANGLIWQARGTYKNAFSYNAPGGRIANTGYNETDFSGKLGLNKKWGYAHLNLSSFRSNVGLPDFTRNADGQFEDKEGNILTDRELKSRTPLLPFQNIRHYKAAINSNILIGQKNRLNSTLAFQDNQRRELKDSSIDPTLFFDLKTYSYDLKYYLAENKGWEPVFGASGQFQNNLNKASELLIPNYTSFAYGLFAYAKKTWTNSTFNLGARFDYHTISAKQMEQDGEPKFSNFKNNFSNLSGALGFTHEFNPVFSFKANAGSAFRAPNIAELSSFGVHEGTFRFEIGNDALKPERSFYADLGLDLTTDKLNFGLSFYNNYINNFIYSRQINHETIDAEGQTFPVFRFVQDNANFYGTEASLTLHPVELIHFENSFSYTHAQNQTTHSPLPFIPAAVLRNELRFEPQFKKFTHSYFSITLTNTFKQSRIADFETPTGGYSLVNASIGGTLKINKQPLKVNISATNLLNKAYFDHLSRFKPGRLDESDPTLGYFNPGRSIVVGVYIPFNLKK